MLREQILSDSEFCGRVKEGVDEEFLYWKESNMLLNEDKRGEELWVEWISR